jgi:hypothetical protein
MGGIERPEAGSMTTPKWTWIEIEHEAGKPKLLEAFERTRRQAIDEVVAAMCIPADLLEPEYPQGLNPVDIIHATAHYGWGRR